MTKNRLRFFLRAVVALLLSIGCAQVYAQYDNGSLVGAIKDSTGAPIPGASVTITNVATSIAITTKTNATGEYTAPELKVGTYNVSATAAGFGDASAKNVAISVGGRQDIDLTLTVGATTESVEVSDVALQIETQESQRDQTVTNYQSEAFPLVTRNYSDLLALIPGSRQAPTAALTSSVSSLLRAGSFNVNGERSMFNKDRKSVV